MGDDEHGIDIEEDTDLETADEEVEEEPPEKEVGREDADSSVRENEALENTNPDNHRDEPPKDS